MRTLYIECNMGAAGDMLMAGLLELHPDPQDFVKRLNELGIPGVEVVLEKATKQGIVGNNIHVYVGGEQESSRDFHHDHEHAHDHEHTHHHEHHQHTHGDLSSLPNVLKIISELPISDKVKQDASSIYQLIAEAEAQAHGIDVAQVHFHEVGALDAVTDIVGNSLLIDELGVDRIVVSPIHVGSGMVRCAHGTLPVPAPATAHILQGIPTYSGSIRGELCTPTGAAILKYFGDDFGPQPVMRVEKIGYGMGKKDFAAANMVRVFLGETDEQSSDVLELVCNLDDMTGEDLGFAMDVLLEAGALEVFFTPVQMKKNRPGVLLSLLCKPEQEDKFTRLIFEHTTTIGLRKRTWQRNTLARQMEQVETEAGEVSVKKSQGYGVTKEKVEHDHAAKIALQYKSSLLITKPKLWKRGGKTK